MDELEDAFLSKSRKLNNKRQEQIEKRFGKILEEAKQLYEEEKPRELELLLAGVKMPSSKEWRKLIQGLVRNSAENGILRADKEVKTLEKAFSLAESDWKTKRASDLKAFEVRLNEDAINYLLDYGLEISTITEDTVLEAIRESILEGLQLSEDVEDIAERIHSKAEQFLSKSHSLTIARTEVAKLYNAGRLARYLASDGTIVALQYESVLDNRTTKLCKDLNGLIIGINNVGTIIHLSPPNHFSCRSTFLPISKYEQWEENWDFKKSPEKGFASPTPLPRLLQSQTGPLVVERA